MRTPIDCRGSFSVLRQMSGLAITMYMAVPPPSTIIFINNTKQTDKSNGDRIHKWKVDKPVSAVLYVRLLCVLDWGRRKRHHLGLETEHGETDVHLRIEFGLWIVWIDGLGEHDNGKFDGL